MRPVVVFIPFQVLQGSSGFLCGWPNDRDRQHVLCILAISSRSSLESTSANLTNSELERLPTVVGYLTQSSSQNPAQNEHILRDCWIDVSVTSTGLVLFNHDKCMWRSTQLVPEDIIAIVYNPSDFKTSEYYSSVNCDNESSIVTVLVQKLNDFHSLPHEVLGKFDYKIDSCARVVGLCSLVPLLEFSLKTCERLESCASLGVIWQGLKQSSAACHLVDRISQLKASTLLCREHHRIPITFWNTLLTLVVDIVIGILVMLAFQHFFLGTKDLLEAFLQWTRLLMTSLHQLIEWLMDVPAGFKLNHPLNRALGVFFAFHISLWEDYVSVVEPALLFILNATIFCGFLGFTTQICFLQDLLSIVTIHIYCFYAYASRLYSLQVSGLTSMWRLFRGKKWNPLRQRVDSCCYGVDQLFLGTLAFTILLFLLPTTMMYYVVFALLRMAVLIVQGLASRFIQATDYLGTYSLMLHIVGSKRLTSGFKFIPAQKNQLLIYMKATAPSLYTTLTRYHLPKPSTHNILSWSELLRKLITGELIYPV